MRDIGIILGKEWLELRRSDSPWVGMATLSVFLGMVGVFLPWLLGLAWLRAPWVMLVWAWIPLFLVTTVAADSFAGERERRTLETLLATRLSDGSILWGKWLASVTWVASAMLLSLPLGIVSLNLFVGSGLHLPGISQLFVTVAVVVCAAGLGAGLGVLVSMRASSVRHAQQILAIIAFLLAFAPIAVIRLMPVGWTADLFRALSTGSPATIGGLLAALLAAVSVPVLGLARHRFRRGRMPLK